MTDARRTVAICIATCNRNGPLERLLESLEAVAAQSKDVFALGVVVTDDSMTGEARRVVERFDDGRFELGIHYYNTASHNIAVSRNSGIEHGLEIADWLAMIDDDCQPEPDWLLQHLEVQTATDADIVTGPFKYFRGEGTPRWLEEQPFMSGVPLYENAEEPPHGSTANAFMRGDWLREHPEIRFNPIMGRTGGEDMVFYHDALKAGLKLRYSRHALVHEEWPKERSGLLFTWGRFFWYGNNMWTIAATTGEWSRGRMFLRGANGLRKALQRPFERLLKKQSPQWRWCVAQSMQNLGLIAGTAGYTAHHH
jgi:succinoglycan biosynthesis protein ExoM